MPSLSLVLCSGCVSAEGKGRFGTVGEVRRLKLSPSESRLTRLRRATLLLTAASSKGHESVSTGLLPFQKTRENGHSPSSPGLSR